MGSLNRVLVCGRLGADPEEKQVGNTNVCNLSVATSESWKDKQGQKQERTEWHRVEVWGKLGELCGQHLTKGREVLIEGRLQTRSWEKDGQKRYMTSIVAERVVFLGSGGKSSGSGSGSSGGSGGRWGGDRAPSEPPASPPPGDDDIPF